jgi:hypothetical protein
MPDGKRLVFTLFPIGTGTGATSLWSVLTDGRGSVEPIRAQWDAYPGGVSADGGTLYYSANQSNQAQEDIVSVALGGAAPKPVALLATPASERSPTPSTRCPLARVRDKRVRQNRDACRSTRRSAGIGAGVGARRQPCSLEP